MRESEKRRPTGANFVPPYCWRAIVGIGGVWRWPSLALIGGGGGSSLLVMLLCVAACNHRHCVLSLSCHSRVFITCGRRLLLSKGSCRRLSSLTVRHRRPSLLGRCWLWSSLRCALVIVMSCCVVICW